MPKRRKNSEKKNLSKWYNQAAKRNQRTDEPTESNRKKRQPKNQKKKNFIREPHTEIKAERMRNKHQTRKIDKATTFTHVVQISMCYRLFSVNNPHTPHITKLNILWTRIIFCYFFFSSFFVFSFFMCRCCWSLVCAFFFSLIRIRVWFGLFLSCSLDFCMLPDNVVLAVCIWMIVTRSRARELQTNCMCTKAQRPIETANEKKTFFFEYGTAYRPKENWHNRKKKNNNKNEENADCLLSVCYSSQ